MGQEQKPLHGRRYGKDHTDHGNPVYGFGSSPEYEEILSRKLRILPQQLGKDFFRFKECDTVGERSCQVDRK